jgi:propionyl-CoA carboxylase alpha chain
LPIRKLLIANRGEIAVRIARTCREMGIRSVGVYSDADRNAPHARTVDEAVTIGASYLDIARILHAARSAGADAIHPGYGFLAENAVFAEACEQAGLIFIGPSAEAIRSMGLKTGARDIAASAGVPIVPVGLPYDGPAGFPVIVKASAGGGGRGMRVVRSPEALAEGLESARGEAERAFGDGSLFIEKYIEGARHIEFQIFGDHHGNVIHLLERDCSVQRRHQKIIEESPSPALDDNLRARMGEAAVAIGKAIGYTNAGTVEFLLAPSGEFYFIEVNTRIQVEHPVTELITGIDLVRLQIEVAEGKPLPRAPRAIGHAIEARLNAEDPLNDFLPSTGTIHLWRPGGQVRVDTAVEDGAEVSLHYDSLLAKLIAFGRDREAAVRLLTHALEGTAVFGVRTNRDYLLQILESEEFRGGRADTAFLPAPVAVKRDYLPYLAAAALHLRAGALADYRNNRFRDASMKVEVDGEPVTISWKRSRDDEYLFEAGGRTARAMRTRNGIEIEGVLRSYEIREAGGEIFVWSSSGDCVFRRLPRHPRSARASEREAANSPMPGKVLRILVTAGQSVKTGDSLVVLEAMKMEQTIRTTINGVVNAILVQPGQVVAPGQKLVEIGALEANLMETTQ